MLKIFGSDLSSPANKVRMVANALEIPYEYVKINLREGEHRTEGYLKKHPAGKVPAMDDDGFILFESNAIARYLCDKQKSDLYPKDIKKRALVDQWLDFSSIHVGGAMGRVVFNRVFAPVRGLPVDEQSLSDGLGFLDRFLPVVDAQLGKKPFLAADELTIADICLVTTIDPAEIAEIDLSPYQNICKWREKIKEQGFYTKCHKEYGEMLKGMLKK